jgi:hypothetical protein
MPLPAQEMTVKAMRQKNAEVRDFKSRLPYAPLKTKI